jgi:hypothetical protein
LVSSVSQYSTAKSAEEIYAIYQQGITYDESSLSGLVGYWRMGDDTSKAFPTIADSSSNSNDGTLTNMASDDIVQQMVAGYDMGAFESTGEELGGETVDNNVASAWTKYNDNVVGDVTGGVKITYATSGSGSASGAKAYFRDNSLLNFNIDASAGKLYKLTFNAYYEGGSSGVYVRVYDTSVDHATPALTTTETTYTLYFKGIHASAIQFYFGYLASSNVVYITNMSFKEVLQSADLSDTFPAIIDVNEPVLGAELWDADASTFDSGTHSWVVYGNNTIANDSGALKITYVDNTNGAYLWFRDSTDLNSDLVVGKLYKLTFDAKVNTGSVDLVVIENGGSTPSATITETSFTSKTVIFKAGSPQHDYIRLAINSGEILFLDNFSLQQIQGNVGTMTNQDSADLVYSSVLPDQSFLATGVNSAYNFIDLDGSDAYIPISVTALGDAFTLSAWVYFDVDASSGDFDYIISLGASGTRTHFSLGRFEDGKFYYFDGSSSKKSTSFTFSTTTWTHVLATVQPTSNRVKLYINGEEQDVAQPDGDFNISSSTGAIGRLQFATSHYFNGRINNVSIINKTISSADVNAIYNLGRHGNLLDSYSDNLVNYYAFGALDAITGLADTDSTIYDRSGNSNHGTPSGIATGDLKSPPNAEPNGYAKGDTNRSTTTP